jgi:hypothetical protein
MPALELLSAFAHWAVMQCISAVGFSMGCVRVSGFRGAIVHDHARVIKLAIEVEDTIR